jgi:alpha-1,3/alpha-1,6-mannosyltransferase
VHNGHCIYSSRSGNRQDVFESNPCANPSGGAERLVIDAAVGLQQRGHKITIYTSHRDVAHCFDEARNGTSHISLDCLLTAGTLNVQVLGNTLFPPHIFGRFSILCAILRQLHLSFTIFFTRPAPPHDILIIDQLSASIPLLRLRYPILFYCHFPDKLLAHGREKWIKQLYRLPFDWIEQITTNLADAIVVNSLFTKGVFKHTFPFIEKVPDVIYPCVDINPAIEPIPKDNPLIPFLKYLPRKD